MSIDRTKVGLALALLVLATAPAWADFRLERELNLAPGGELVLDADAGALEVEGVAGSGVRILVTSDRSDIDDRFTFTFREEAGRVVVQAKKRGGIVSRWLNWRGERLRFEITVPTQTDLDLRTAGGSIRIDAIAGDVGAHTSGGRIELTGIDGPVDVETSGGSISARGIGGAARLDTSGGRIVVEDVQGDLYADTSGGSIRVERVLGAVDADTSGGSIELREVGGRIKASSSGGPVVAYFAAGNGEGGSLSTSGGGVTAYVDPAAALDVDASTSGGRVSVDLPITVQGSLSKTAVRGTLNGGGAPLRLRSSGGSIFDQEIEVLHIAADGAGDDGCCFRLRHSAAHCLNPLITRAWRK